MSNIFLLSDNHFSHKNICKGESNWSDKNACRDFPTIKDHDDYLIDVTNKKVKSTDIIFDLGDWGLGHGLRDNMKALRERINCQTIYLARGNHDSLFTERNRTKFPDLFALFKDVQDMYYKKICGRFVVMCHYAMLTWMHQSHGSIMCHGHSHNNLKYPSPARILDVGRDVDIFGHKKYEPFSCEEIFHIIDTYRNEQIILDHHSSSIN